MNFLITNDDGWGVPGIERLAAIAGQFGTATIVAPATAQSGISHQLTLDRAMAFEQKTERSYSLDGTPADCVRFGLNHLGVEFDWVLSGINHGANLGVDVYVSGTVAAAREATFHGVNAIALSQYRIDMSTEAFDWDRSADWSRVVLESLVEQHSATSDRALFNINLPDGNSDGLPEIVHCEADMNHLPTEYHTSGGSVKFSGSYRNRARDAGKDIDVCFGGKIAVSRLSF